MHVAYGSNAWRLGADPIVFRLTHSGPDRHVGTLWERKVMSPIIIGVSITYKTRVAPKNLVRNVREAFLDS